MKGSQGPLRPLLEATISVELTDKLFSYLESCDETDQLKNLWLMCPSVRSALVCFSRRPYHHDKI